MKARPGGLLPIVLAMLAAWMVVAFYWSLAGWLIPLALVVAGVLAAVDFVHLRRDLSALRVRRTAPSLVGRGQPFVVELSIDNTSVREQCTEVRDEVPAAAVPRFWMARADVAARQTTKTSTTFTIPVRGRYNFGPAWVRLLGRFGLVEAQRAIDELQSVQVYPESLLSPHELAKDAANEVRLLDQLRQTRLHGPGTEFESLEEFRRGDDPRHIDWRASARHRRPTVRRFQVERHRDIMLLLDCGRLMGADAQRGTKLDCAIDAALRLLRIALRGGDRCGLGIFADSVLGYLRPIGGTGSLPHFLASLYDVQPRWKETDFGPMFARLQTRLTKRALVIVLSDVVDTETSTRFRTSLATLARRHVVLFVALQTPMLRSVMAEPLDSLDRGFRKAVTLRILREREQAIHALRRGGVHVLDVEPAQLTAPLINRFIELRRSSQL